MPELPEVETVKRTLLELVKGKVIKGVWIGWPKMIKHPDDQEIFRSMLQGQTIQTIGRRGKFLKFYLDDYVLVSHLRMEGRYEMAEGDPDPHVHVRFFFTDGSELRYRDVRKFGTMHLFPKGTEDETLPLKQLGPEPLSESFTAEYLASVFAKTTRYVKTVLLDQKAVAGLGNIYVDESLFLAGIHPETTAQALNHEQIEKLYEAIETTIAKAVESGGSSVRSYVNGLGDVGRFQLQLYVYGRKNEHCHTCGTSIERLVVGGRGTHYCPSCQQKI